MTVYRFQSGHARTKPLPFSAENAGSYYGGVSLLFMRYVTALGKGAVTAGPDGLRLVPAVLNHQLHAEHWDKQIPCSCARCKQARVKQPLLAAVPAPQPWDVRRAA